MNETHVWSKFYEAIISVWCVALFLWLSVEVDDGWLDWVFGIALLVSSIVMFSDLRDFFNELDRRSNLRRQS